MATPIGSFGVRALLDDQELDSRASTGAIYWEGLSLLDDAQGRRVGRGYLEMTGYAARSCSERLRCASARRVGIDANHPCRGVR